MDRRTFLVASSATAAVAVTPLPAVAPPKRYFIMPDITMCERVTKTAHDNCWTIHYSWMTRMTPDGHFERAHVNTRRYRDWLVDDPGDHGIPPHIQFGGAIVSDPAGDPTFHARWVEYAKATFV